MESPQVPRKSTRDASRIVYVLMAIAAVVILVLAATTVFYHSKVKDYHDAKYRAQAVLVMEARGAVFATKAHIEIMLNDSWALASRREFALFAQGEANMAASYCKAIAFMYQAGDDRYDTFYSLSQAMGAVAWMIGQGRAQLSGMNVTVTEALNATAGILGDLDELMSEGYDAERDWLNEPYSMVDRMDLDLIGQAVDSLNAAILGG